ncbi:UvrD/REP family ATP-dependent DNA helicase [Shouchella clausii KSM-K16]|uniref:DNA 3'-5' helicase n=2 Tax=Shouchella clausii TaxID=79880 RepID=Q5WF16_SHOC1|nr:UvrD/REP family ATP-dependent DNA helicase [Shouchella clausii KSM-K16]
MHPKGVSMNTALYLNEPLYLPELDRGKWHTFYLLSKKGLLHCIHCGAPLSMSFSIHQKPSFIHPPSGDNRCREQVEAFEQARQAESQTAATTAHGFRLPQRRAVLNTTPAWKAPLVLSNVAPFTVPASTKQMAMEGYREQLTKAGLTLDDAQWKAVKHIDGPLLLLAGAGCGKTRVLTARAAYMISEANIHPNKMALVTFTAKAAQEMRERMTEYPGIEPMFAQSLLIRTFHSLFYTMLVHADPSKWHGSKLIKSGQELLKTQGRALGLDESEFPYDQAATQISWWKNHMIAPEHVETTDPFEEKAALLYEHYEKALRETGRFDFDDMQLGCLYVLQENNRLLQRYQERFAYLLIDEFQDINPVQFEIVKLLAMPQRNICVVGDDDQSIYRFRGSDPRFIRSFTAHYPEAKTIHLVENYRSSHPIIASANRVIAENRTRLEKTLVAQHTSDQLPYLFFPYNEEEEATMIVEEIKRLIGKGICPSEIAVLYRTSTSVRALVDRLVDTTLPFSLEQGFACFYERPFVRRALSFLRIGRNEESPYVMVELLKALFIKQEHLDQLLHIQKTERCSLLEAIPFLTELPAFQAKKLKTLPADCRRMQKMNPSEALAFAEARLGLNETIKKQGQEGNKFEKGSDDFNQLKVAATQFETVESFLIHIDHVIAKQQECQTFQTRHPKSIQLLTIHRSKGLEFSHVFIVGAVEGSLPHDYALDAWREGDDGPLQEERRLMYVAMTRAKKELAISAPVHYRGKRAHPTRFVCAA